MKTLALIFCLILFFSGCSLMSGNKIGTNQTQEQIENKKTPNTFVKAITPKSYENWNPWKRILWWIGPGH